MPSLARPPLWVSPAAALLAAALCPSPASAAFTLQNPTATFSQTGFGAAATIDGNPGTGWAIDPQERTSQTIVWETQTNQGFVGGTNLTFSIQQAFGDSHTIGRFRLSVTTDDRSLFADGLGTGGDVTANWVQLTPTFATATNGATLTVQGDNSVLASGTIPITSTYTVNAFTTLTGITGFRLEALTDPSLPFQGPGRQPTNGNFVLTEFSVDGTPVPAPQSAVLVGIGIGCLALFRRSRIATA